MKYEMKLKIRLAYFSALIVCGIFATAVGIVLNVRGAGASGGYLLGLGCAFAAVGGIAASRLVSTMKDAEKLRAKRIRETDERNSLISMASSHIAYVTVMLLLFAGSVYYAFTDEKVQRVLEAVILLLFIVKGLALLITRRRM